MAATGLRLADVFLALGLDDKAYREGLKRLEAAGDDSGKKLQKSITLKTLLQDIELGRKKMLVLKDAGSLVGSTLHKASTSATNALNTGLTKAKTLLSDIGKGFAIGIGIGSFQALGQGLADVIGFIPSLIEKGKQYGLLVDSIADSTGATAEESSKLAATLQYLGAPTGSIVTLFGQMAARLDENRARLKAWGIETEDANGISLNQVQILEQLRQKLSGLADGQEKAAILTTLARGGLKVFVDYMQLTDEQYNLLIEDFQRGGLILTEEQRRLAETSEFEGNRFNNALTGLGVALFTTVGPQIRAFFSGLTEWVVTHVEAIRTAVANAISFVVGLAQGLLGASGDLSSFAGSLGASRADLDPYAASIAKLGQELAELPASTAAAATGIDRQTRAIAQQTAALQAKEQQEQQTFAKAMARIAGQLTAQEILLSAEERGLQNQRTDESQSRSLADAKRELFEAQAQLRADTLAGEPTDQDTLAIARAQQAVLDAQRTIDDTATQRTSDARRAQLSGIKEYIASIEKLVDESTNKAATARTLQAREDILEARRAAALATGDTTGAGDIGAQIAAIQAGEKRIAEARANAGKETYLAAKRAQLEQEKAAVAGAADFEVEARRKGIQASIKHLLELQVAWTESNLVITEDGKEAFRGLGAVIRGDGKGTGLAGAFRETRDAGVEMGTKIKAALVGLEGTLNGIGDALAWIATHGDTLAALVSARVLGGVNPLLALPTTVGGDTPPRAGSGSQLVIDRLRGKDPKAAYNPDAVGVYGSLLRPGMTNAEAAAALVKAGYGRASGGMVGERGPKLAWLGEQGRELVLSNPLTEKLDRFLSGAQTPAMAAVGGPSSWGGPVGDPVIVRVEVGGNRLIDYLNTELFLRRRTGRRP